MIPSACRIWQGLVRGTSPVTMNLIVAAVAELITCKLTIIVWKHGVICIIGYCTVTCITIIHEKLCQIRLLLCNQRESTVCFPVCSPPTGNVIQAAMCSCYYAAVT